MNCELCNLRNPKSCATAIIIRDNKLLLLKRNEEPFKGMWDLVGGYMSEGETSHQAVIREVEEELGVKPEKVTPMTEFPGNAYWKDKAFPIISHFYLVETGDQEIKLNDENSEYAWISLKDLDPNFIAFDSNSEFIAEYLKKNFTFDLERVRELTKQLDPTAVVDEQALYKAVLCGFVAKEYDGDKLVGMGWIYGRTTMLRHQAVVEDMVVAESHRGQGIGDKLLVKLLDWAKSNGLEVVELTSGYHRKAAHGLYKKHGFKIHETAHMLKDMRIV